jgi:fibronectin type 3 domain-containing protein
MRIPSIWPLAGIRPATKPADSSARTRNHRRLALFMAAVLVPLGLLWATSIATGAGDTVVEAESLPIAADFGGKLSSDANASGGQTLTFWANDTATGSVTTGGPTTTLTLRARADVCQGGAIAVVKVDGTTVLTATASTATFADYSSAVNIPAGTHSVSLSFTNDLKTSSCDRNLRADKLTFVGGGGGGGGDVTPPAAPISLGATPGDAKVSLSWAANTESDLAGYNVYRSITSGSSYSKVNSALVTTASYTDSTVTNGTKYFYVVRAVDTSTNSSGNSNEASATPTAAPDTTPPPVPTGLNGTPGNATASLTWSPVSASDLAGYNLYRGTATGGPYTKVNTSVIGGTSFNDTGLTNGTTYFYVVRSIDTTGNESGNSTQTSAAPTAGGGGGGSTTIEAENFTIPADFGGRVYTDTSASGGRAVSFWSNDSISTTVNTVAGSQIVVRAFGDQCNGAPNLVLAMDGTNVLSTAVPAGSWTAYTVAKTVTAGSHTFTLSFTNDAKTSTCDRNLRADSVTVNSGSGGTPSLLLPDLVQEPPTKVSVTQSSASFRLGMNSAVENFGAGPLLVNGHRASTATANMTADQIINRTDGSTQTFPAIGTIFFYAPHNHWHYQGFDKYELHSPSTNALVAPDQKSGFCLGDRYTLNSNGTRNENPSPGPFTTNNCAPGNTAARNVTEGISVGYGDEYEPQLEGQYIDVTGVQPGQYLIVHRTNSDQALQESNYNNDAASVLVSLWPNGYGNLTGGGVTVLKTCPTSPTCSLTANAPTGQSIARAIRRLGVPVGGLPFQLRHSPPPDDPPLLVPRAARFYAH